MSILIGLVVGISLLLCPLTIGILLFVFLFIVTRKWKEIE